MKYKNFSWEIVVVVVVVVVVHHRTLFLSTLQTSAIIRSPFAGHTTLSPLRFIYYVFATTDV